MTPTKTQIPVGISFSLEVVGFAVEVGLRVVRNACFVVFRVVSATVVVTATVSLTYSCYFERQRRNTTAGPCEVAEAVPT